MIEYDTEKMNLRDYARELEELVRNESDHIEQIMKCIDASMSAIASTRQITKQPG